MDIEGLIIGVSKIIDGNMSVNWGEKSEVLENRRIFAEKIGLRLEDCVIASLSGGTDVAVVGESDKNNLVECDAMITREAGVGLWMVTADCLPVVLYESIAGMLALVHAGWRGIDGKILPACVLKMAQEGANIPNIQVWIGPGVRKDTYLKYGEKLAEFRNLINPENTSEWQDFLVEQKTPGRYGVDLAGYAIKQLTKAGIHIQNIEVSNIDTIANSDYFSHYRAGATKEKEGRFATVVMRSSK